MNGSKGQRTTENFLKQRLKEFEKKENIQVRIKLISWHRAYENIVSSFKSSNSPDVFQVGSSWVSSLAYLNYLKVINDYQDDKTLLACWMDGCCHFQGERVGVPWIIDSEIMVARNDIIQKVGLDIKKLNTWEEFYQAHLRLNQYRRLDSSFPKVMSFAIRPDLNTLHRFISWYFANGYDVPDLNSKEILATSNIIEVFQYFRSLIEISDVDLSDVDKHPYQGNEDFYNKGSYVFYLGNWYGVIMKVLGQSNYINDELELVPMNIPSKNSRIGTHGGGSVLAVSSQSKYPDKA
ncbi:MAG: extracellular solute-binding protein, partial [Halanaerobiales bacterium]